MAWNQLPAVLLLRYLIFSLVIGAASACIAIAGPQEHARMPATADGSMEFVLRTENCKFIERFQPFVESCDLVLALFKGNVQLSVLPSGETIWQPSRITSSAPIQTRGQSQILSTTGIHAVHRFAFQPVRLSVNQFGLIFTTERSDPVQGSGHVLIPRSFYSNWLVTIRRGKLERLLIRDESDQTLIPGYIKTFRLRPDSPVEGLYNFRIKYRDGTGLYDWELFAYSWNPEYEALQAYDLKAHDFSPPLYAVILGSFKSEREASNGRRALIGRGMSWDSCDANEDFYVFESDLFARLTKGLTILAAIRTREEDAIALLEACKRKLPSLEGYIKRAQ